jgi:predicted  nucleic acid-binding Zn-ribbon protein
VTTTTVMPDGAGGGSGGHCKRAGCGRPLPPGERGRARQFCSDDCRNRHYNAMRGKASAVAPPPTDGPEAGLARLMQLLTESSRLAAAVSAQVAEANPGRVAAVLAEADAARRRAEAHAATASAQSAESAASASAAWEAVDAAESLQTAAQTRAEEAEEQGRALQAKVGDLSGQLDAALQRAQAAEYQVADAFVQRDAARKDAERTADTLAGERGAAREDVKEAHQQAAREIAGVRDACEVQTDAAREIANAAVTRAERAEAELDAERAERRTLTDKLNAVSAHPALIRARTIPKKQT